MSAAVVTLYATFGSPTSDEPLSVSTSLGHARQLAAIFARNGGRPVTIAAFSQRADVELVEP